MITEYGYRNKLKAHANPSPNLWKLLQNYYFCYNCVVQ